MFTSSCSYTACTYATAIGVTVPALDKPPEPCQHAPFPEENMLFVALSEDSGACF